MESLKTPIRHGWAFFLRSAIGRIPRLRGYRRVPCGVTIQDCQARENPGMLDTPRSHRCRSRAHRDDPLYLRLPPGTLLQIPAFEPVFGPVQVVIAVSTGFVQLFVGDESGMPIYKQQGKSFVTVAKVRV